MIAGFLKRFKSLWLSLLAILSVQPIIGPFADDIFGFLNVSANLQWVVQAPFAVLGIGLLLNVFTTVRYAERPLSVIKSKIKINIDCPNGNMAHTERLQLLRAEQPDVCARYREISEHIGEIDIDSLTHTRIPNDPTDKTLQFGTSKSVTFVSCFDKPLPYSWLGQLLLPDSIFAHFANLDNDEYLPNWMHKFVVLEKSNHTEIGEYCRKRAWFSLIAQRYVASDLLIIVRFHEDNPPAEFKAYVQRSPTIDSVATHTRVDPNGSTVCSVKFPRLRDETATVVWEFTNDPKPATE